MEYKCPVCQTIYFEEQECDWCPDVIAQKEELANEASDSCQDKR